MKKFPIKTDHPDDQTLAPQGEPYGLRYRPSDALARGGAAEPGVATITRIVELLIEATADGKISWFRDAEYFAVTYFPMLAVTFRLQVSGPLQSSFGGGYAATEKTSFDPSRAMHLSIAFIDNKEFRCLASQYSRIHDLSKLVWSTFEDAFQRDRNERLEWLEKALRVFLPHVVSSNVDPEDEP